MKEESSMNVWKESFLIKIRFWKRKDDLRKVAGNWTWPETGPHTVLSYYKVEGFSSPLVCFAFIFCRAMTFIRYIGVDFTFGVLNCVRYIEDFVISRFAVSRFCSIHFAVTLAGLKNIVC